MEDICCATGTSCAILLQTDVRTPDVPRTAGAEELASIYFGEGWHTRDVRVRTVPLLLAGRPVVTEQDIPNLDDSEAQFYYNEFLRRCRFSWFAGIGFSAGRNLWALALQRTEREGAFTDDDKRLLAELSPHLTEAATLSTAMGRSVVSGIADALRAIGRPALFLDRFGFVLDHNALADELFDDELRVHNRRLIIGDPNGKASFEDLVDRLRSTPDRAGFPTLTFLVRRERRSAVLAHVVPVPASARGPFLGARALLLLSELQAAPRLEPRLVARVFGLTRAEATLASLIGVGMAPADAAMRLGVSRETVRNQLKAVFSKTDTHRQSELVLLLSRLS
jgi:DNA-binding CsgD family transcriptional regulator